MIRLEVAERILQASAYPPAMASKGQLHSALLLPKPLHRPALLLALEQPRGQQDSLQITTSVGVCACGSCVPLGIPLPLETLYRADTFPEQPALPAPVSFTHMTLPTIMLV